MSRETQLIKNTTIITIGKVSTQMINFFLLPLYTSVLSTEEYGTVDLITTLVTLMIPIITFQIEQALFRYLVDNRENIKLQKIIITNALGSVIIQCIIFSVIFMIFSILIKNQFKYYFFSNIIASILSSTFLQLSRGMGDNITYTIGSSIIAISTIMLNILFLVVFSLNIIGMLLASIISNILCFIYIFLILKVYKYIDWSLLKKQTIKMLWRYSIPLVPNALSWWIFNASDRIIVSFFLGNAANGILAIVHKFPQIFISVFNIFNISWTESASLHINDVDAIEYFNNVINVMFRIFSSMCLMIIVIMPIAFPILVNAQYTDAFYYIPGLMIASLGNIGVGLISVIYVAKKDTKAIASTSIVSAILNIIISLLLINFIGLNSVIIATFIAYYSMFIYRYIHVQKYLKIKINIKYLILTIFVFILCSYIYTKKSLFNIWINIIIAIIYILYINKTFVRKIINYIY